MRTFERVFDKLSGLKVSHLMPSDKVENDTDLDYEFQKSLIVTKIDIDIKGDKEFDINIDFNRDLSYQLTPEIRKSIEESFRYAVIDIVILKNLKTGKLDKRKVIFQANIFKLEILEKAFSLLRNKLSSMKNIRRTETHFTINRTETLKLFLANETKIVYEPSLIDEEEGDDEYDGEEGCISWSPSFSMEELRRFANVKNNLNKKYISGFNEDKFLDITKKDYPEISPISKYDVAIELNKIGFSKNFQLNELLREEFLKIEVSVNVTIMEDKTTALLITLNSDGLDSALLPDLETIDWVRHQFSFLEEEIFNGVGDLLEKAGCITNIAARSIIMGEIVKDFVYENSLYLSKILIHNLYENIKAGNAPNNYFYIDEIADDAMTYISSIDNMFKSVKKEKR